jgi:hypothetical protein
VGPELLKGGPELLRGAVAARAGLGLLEGGGRGCLKVPGDSEGARSF